MCKPFFVPLYWQKKGTLVRGPFLPGYQRSDADAGLVAGAVTRAVVSEVVLLVVGAVGGLTVTASLAAPLDTAAITRYPGNASGHPEQ